MFDATMPSDYATHIVGLVLPGRRLATGCQDRDIVEDASHKNGTRRGRRCSCLPGTPLLLGCVARMYRSSVVGLKIASGQNRRLIRELIPAQETRGKNALPDAMHSSAALPDELAEQSIADNPRCIHFIVQAAG